LYLTFAGELSKRSANIDLQGNFSLSSEKQGKTTQYPSLQPALLEVSPGIAVKSQDDVIWHFRCTQHI